MNKLAIPVILAATVMVAGMFAFMPVEQASTVHTSGTITLAASQGTIIAIDIVDESFVDLGNSSVTFTLIDTDNFPAGAHYTASFVLSLHDDVDTDGNSDPPTVTVLVWDGEGWGDVQATVPTPADGFAEATVIVIAGEVSPTQGTLRLNVFEGGSDTEASINVQGTIEIR